MARSIETQAIIDQLNAIQQATGNFLLFSK